MYIISFNVIYPTFLLIFWLITKYDLAVFLNSFEAESPHKIFIALYHYHKVVKLAFFFNSIFEKAQIKNTKNLTEISSSYEFVL